MICGLEARFRDGDLWVSPSEDRRAASPSASPSAAPSPEALDRLQALLGLAESGGAVLLGGRYAAYAAGLQARLDLMVVVMDPDDATFTSAARVIGCDSAMPFTEGTFRAAALDDPRLLPAAVRVVRAGGRLVAPLTCPRPSSIALLASDASEWVGERGATPTVVPLQRSARSRPQA
jgi:hypothetical protein